MGFRYYGVYETGVCFAILIVNGLSGWLDRAVDRLYRPRHASTRTMQKKEAAQ